MFCLYSWSGLGEKQCHDGLRVLVAGAGGEGGVGLVQGRGRRHGDERREPGVQRSLPRTAVKHCIVPSASPSRPMHSRHSMLSATSALLSCTAHGFSFGFMRRSKMPWPPADRDLSNHTKGRF